MKRIPLRSHYLEMAWGKGYMVGSVNLTCKNILLKDRKCRERIIMKKKFFLVAMMLVAILTLSACSSKEDSNNGTSDVSYNEDNTEPISSSFPEEENGIVGITQDNVVKELNTDQGQELSDNQTNTDCNVSDNETELDDSELMEVINRNRIAEQSFEVSLNDWGNVTFVSCMPDASDRALDPLTDISFFLLSDDHILYRFPGVSNNNVRATGLCEGVSFVYFEDINGDNKRDIVIGVLYVSGAGPQGMIPYTEIRIYEDNGNEFVINKDLCDEVNENLGAEVTAEDVKTLIKNSAN